MADNSASAPTASPPEGAAATAVEERPVDLEEELLAEATAAADAAAAPTLEPPAAAAAAAEAVGAWLSDKRVTALWGNNAPRNAWAHVAGVGWRRFYNASDSSVTAMTMLASHARQANARFDYREESDGMIHEIYVW